MIPTAVKPSGVPSPEGLTFPAPFCERGVARRAGGIGPASTGIRGAYDMKSRTAAAEATKPTRSAISAAGTAWRVFRTPAAPK